MGTFNISDNGVDGRRMLCTKEEFLLLISNYSNGKIKIDKDIALIRAFQITPNTVRVTVYDNDYRFNMIDIHTTLDSYKTFIYKSFVDGFIHSHIEVKKLATTLEIHEGISTLQIDKIDNMYRGVDVTEQELDNMSTGADVIHRDRSWIVVIMRRVIEVTDIAFDKLSDEDKSFLILKFNLHKYIKGGIQYDR